MITWFYIPALPRMTGGLSNLLGVAKGLAEMGWPVKLVSHLPYSAEIRATGLDTCGLGCKPEHKDVWVCPEGWPNALAPGLKAGARTVVYAQNWAYLLAELPPGVNLSALPLHYLAVSRPVAWHIKWVVGEEAQVLPPVVDGKMFWAGEEERSLRVGWMPRKNKVLGKQIREMVEARRARLGQKLPEWVELEDLSREEVAEALRSCAVFLNTGFPEGFGLPALEAMASGCLTVGFSGFGGWDYMRLPGGELPKLPDDLKSVLPKLPGNGLWVPDGDVCAGARALDYALGLVNSEDGESRVHLKQLLKGGQETAALYGLAAQRQRLWEIWQRWLPRHEK